MAHDWQYKVGDHNGKTCYWVVCAEHGENGGHFSTKEAAKHEIMMRKGAIAKVSYGGLLTRYGLNRRLRKAKKQRRKNESTTTSKNNQGKAQHRQARPVPVGTDEGDHPRSGGRPDDERPEVRD